MRLQRLAFDEKARLNPSPDNPIFSLSFAATLKQGSWEAEHFVSFVTIVDGMRRIPLAAAMMAGSRLEARQLQWYQGGLAQVFHDPEPFWDSQRGWLF